MDDEFESDIEKYGLGSNFVSQWWDSSCTWPEVERLAHGAYLFCPEKSVRDELIFLYEIASTRYRMEKNV